MKKFSSFFVFYPESEFLAMTPYNYSTHDNTLTHLPQEVYVFHAVRSVHWKQTPSSNMWEMRNLKTQPYLTSVQAA